MSKLSDFLEKNKIDKRRLLAASQQEESLRPEDRAVKLAKRRSKGGDEAKASEATKELAAKARRGGRALSQPTLARALQGGALPAKRRDAVVRAVNHVLRQKKKSEVSAPDLF